MHTIVEKKNVISLKRTSKNSISKVSIWFQESNLAHPISDTQNQEQSEVRKKLPTPKAKIELTRIHKFKSND